MWIDLFRRIRKLKTCFLKLLMMWLNLQMPPKSSLDELALMKCHEISFNACAMSSEALIVWWILKQSLPAPLCLKCENEESLRVENKLGDVNVSQNSKSNSCYQHQKVIAMSSNIRAKKLQRAFHKFCEDYWLTAYHWVRVFLCLFSRLNVRHVVSG